jgi:hypothetical protein
MLYWFIYGMFEIAITHESAAATAFEQLSLSPSSLCYITTLLEYDDDYYYIAYYTRCDIKRACWN